MAGGRHEKVKVIRDDLVVRLKIDDTGWTLKEASPTPWQAATINDAPYYQGPKRQILLPTTGNGESFAGTSLPNSCRDSCTLSMVTITITNKSDQLAALRSGQESPAIAPAVAVFLVKA